MITETFEIGFDAIGRPTHCGNRMEDDCDMQLCNACGRYIQTYRAMAAGRARGFTYAD
jgi:hypothetical protein